MHWVAAIAIFCMITSGWAIYNASPSLPFVFPRWMTLGGWLAAGIAWHLSAIWVLFADGLAYLAYGGISGHFRRTLRIPGPRDLFRDARAALHGRLRHRLGEYNAVQRFFYIGVIIVLLIAIATGFAIWKPVQLSWLTRLLGGYPIARCIHLAMMICIVGFLVVHLTLAALFPRTLVAMLVGTQADREKDCP